MAAGDDLGLGPRELALLVDLADAERVAANVSYVQGSASAILGAGLVWAKLATATYKERHVRFTLTAYGREVAEAQRGKLEALDE